MFFDWMVTGGILAGNPASAVRGQKYVIKKGKTPVLTPEEARLLLDSIPLVRKTGRRRQRGSEPEEKPCLAGFRDRALLTVMVYTFARVSAVVGMNVEDYYQQGKRWWVRLHEKGGRHYELPVHHKAEEYLDAYLKFSGIGAQKSTPLWRSLTKERNLAATRMSRHDVLRMVKRRCDQAALGGRQLSYVPGHGDHCISALNGGTLEHAQQMAAHESPRTTKLYDRTSDEITLDEIERIGI
jgi:integrase/recombinase XerD